MKIAFDVQYYDDHAKSVAICFDHWQDGTPNEIIEKKIDEVAEYVPGEFYKRELPCIMSILNDLNLADVACIVVDGYVHLDDDGKLGLGGHLYEKLDGKIPVIGVAKSSFQKNKNNVLELLRGQSEKPLYITAVGIEMAEARKHIESMHGKYRMPTLLQILDTTTKTQNF